MKKDEQTPDYSGWEIVDEAPDYSGWELVGDGGSTPPPPEDPYANAPAWIQALNRFNEAPLTKGFKTGIERTTHGLLQPLYESGLLGQGFKESSQNIARQREQEYAQASQQAPFMAGLGNVLGAVGSTLPTALIGGSAASKALPYAGRIGSGALGAALEGGLFGGAQYTGEDESRLGNALQDALFAGGASGALGLAGKGVGALKNKFLPSAEHIAQKFTGNISPEELKAAQRATQGTYTPIGDVIRSADLKKQFENKIAPGLGSNVGPRLSALEGQITDKATNVLEKLGGNNVGKDTNDLTKKLIENAYKKQTKIKNELYKDVSNISANEGFNLNLDSFLNVAKDSRQLLEESLLAKADPQFKKILQKIDMLESGARATSDVSLKDAQILANKLNEQARTHLNSPLPGDRYSSGLYNKLSNAIRSDIKEEVGARGSEKLQQALNSANENYKKNYAGFLDKDIYKYTIEGKDADAIVRDIIRPSKAHDKAARIKKVQQLLPEDEKNILGYTLLQGAIDREGKLDARKINTILNGLGKRQFNALFPDKAVRREVQDLQKLISMNSEALNRMYNPKTGGRLQENVSALKDIGVALGAGKLKGALPGVATLGATVARNKVLGNRFTDETFRDAVVNSALGLGKSSKSRTNGAAYKALIAALKNPNEQDKEK